MSVEIVVVRDRRILGKLHRGLDPLVDLLIDLHSATSVEHRAYMRDLITV